MINEMLGNRLFSITTVYIPFVFRDADSDVSACLPNILFSANRTGDAINNTSRIAGIGSNDWEVGLWEILLVVTICSHNLHVNLMHGRQIGLIFGWWVFRMYQEILQIS